MFQYLVFWSRQEDPTPGDRNPGVFLTERADAVYLQQFFDPLYESHRIGIVTSDDEVIPPDALDALRGTITTALSVVRTRPNKWPVVVGYRREPKSGEPDEPIVECASRARLLEFLEAVDQIVAAAAKEDGYVHFGGGE